MIRQKITMDGHDLVVMTLIEGPLDFLDPVQVTPVAPSLRATLDALEEWKFNLRWLGMAHLVRRRWRSLLLTPQAEYENAARLTYGIPA